MNTATEDGGCLFDKANTQASDPMRNCLRSSVSPLRVISSARVPLMRRTQP